MTHNSGTPQATVFVGITL